MGALRRAGHRVGAVQGRPGLHRPRLPRAGGAAGRAATSTRCWWASELIGPLYRHGSAGADIAVVEGVMGLFDGRIERRLGRHRAGVHRPRRRAARRAGDPGRRRPRPEPQHCGSAARLFDVRPIRAHRRGHPQPGRLAAARGGAAAGLRARRRAGARRDPARRRTVRAVTAPRPGHRRRARRAGAGRRRGDDRTGGPPRRRRWYRRRGGQSSDRRAVGSGRRRAHRPRTSPSRWRRARRSASATPNTASCCAPQAPTSSSSTR